MTNTSMTTADAIAAQDQTPPKRAVKKTDISIAAKSSRSKASKSSRAGEAKNANKPSAPAPAPKEKRQTKASTVEALLARKAGASLDQTCEATGW